MKYAVKEVFETLQGEGGRAGCKSMFVRFSGCNLWNGLPAERDKGSGACSQWCDTDFFKGEPLTTGEVLHRMEAAWSGGERWCVLTGGEPLLQVLRGDLVDVLASTGWCIAVETNGTIAPTKHFDWLTVSPKLGAPLNVTEATELKVVLPGGDPGWTDEQMVELERKVMVTHLFVQPQDPIHSPGVEMTYLRRNIVAAKPEYQVHLRRCIDFVMRHPRWRVGLQTHKFMEMP